MTLVELRRMMIGLKKKYFQLFFYHINKEDLLADIDSLIEELEQCMIDLSVDMVKDEVNKYYMDMIISSAGKDIIK